MKTNQEKQNEFIAKSKLVEKIAKRFEKYMTSDAIRLLSYSQIKKLDNGKLSVEEATEITQRTIDKESDSHWKQVCNQAFSTNDEDDEF